MTLIVNNNRRRSHTALPEAKQLRVRLHRVIDCHKAIAILTLNALLLCAGLELAARSTSNLKSLFSRPTEELVGQGQPRESLLLYISGLG